jgi:hypothetical protein
LKKARRGKAAALAAAAALAGTAAQADAPSATQSPDGVARAGSADAGTLDNAVRDAGAPANPDKRRPGPRPLYGVPPMRGK